MSKMEEVEVAEARMNAAKDGLLNYIEARKSIDHDQYRRLLARVKKTGVEFAKILSQLGD